MKPSKSTITVVVLVIIFLVLGFIIIKKNSTNIPNPSRTTLPISASHPNVLNATVFYSFKSEIKSFEDNKLVLMSNNEKLPDFRINDKTKIATYAGDGEKDAKKGVLKKGASAFVTASFDFTKQTWTVTKVVVILPR